MEPVVLYKKIGETPLACMERYRLEVGIGKDISMTYAGRLDPLAEGVLLVLVGDAVHDKEKYLNLDKEYIVDVLLGVSTDTHDVLGLVEEAGAGSGVSPAPDTPTQSKIKSVLSAFVGTHIQKYPRFSSRTIFGRPLFFWARQGKLEDKDLPTHEVTIYDIGLLNMYTISKEELFREVNKKVDMVAGDFRQKDIMSSWRGVLTDKRPGLPYNIITIKVKCSSGTYMRTLAYEIGQTLSVPALAFSIKRIKVGDFSLDSLRSRN